VNPEISYLNIEKRTQILGVLEIWVEELQNFSFLLSVVGLIKQVVISWV
jgi:hypothetical protein